MSSNGATTANTLTFSTVPAGAPWAGHCPKCQGLARANWLGQRQAELLPVEYFHVVFTLPEAIAAIAFYNKAVVYDILFRATAQTLLEIAADPQRLGVEIGFFAVLHSWGRGALRALHFHPHLHCVVPGGGLSPGADRWIHARRRAPRRPVADQIPDVLAHGIAVAQVVVAGQQAVEEAQVSRCRRDDAHGQRPQLAQRAADRLGCGRNNRHAAIAEPVGRKPLPGRRGAL